MALSRIPPDLPSETPAVIAAAVGLATFTRLPQAHEDATGVVKSADLMERQQKDMKLIGEMAKGKTELKGEAACVNLFSRTPYLGSLV